ncbi:MAG: GNAT family N-acetyltransferase [Bacteroidota bacterium]|nr:GNAT family N-acetyltransferase [Bacteroidota bacterium]
MRSDTIIIREPQTSQEFEAYYLLRYEVLRKPWNQPPGSEKDAQENEAIHMMAVNDQNEVLGVCRLQMNSSTEAQLRFMGVKENTQGLGIGKKMIRAAEEKAISLGAKVMILQAREIAVDFYKKTGYSVKEKSFLMWDQIQHYLMQKNI